MKLPTPIPVVIPAAALKESWFDQNFSGKKIFSTEQNGFGHRRAEAREGREPRQGPGEPEAEVLRRVDGRQDHGARREVEKRSVCYF